MERARRMRRGKFRYCVFSWALMVLPLGSLADVTAPNSTAPTAVSSSSSSTDKAGGEPLFLSLSLSLSPSAIHHGPPAISTANGSTVATKDEVDKPLPLHLSLSRSAPSIQSITNDNGSNAPVYDKDFGDNDINSRAALFGDAEPAMGETAHVPAWKKLVTGWRGFSQLEIADNYSSPEHFSKAKLRTELSRTGQLNEYIKWKISGRFDYDAAYDVSNFYPPAVRRDQRQEFFLRENYLDISAGNFDIRIGRQHVVWGEMVGLFFADVVSAKDMREFVLPAFDILRIPQWAVRAEYSKNNTHAEVLWIPVPTIDEIGKPGADFYPLRGPAAFLNEDRSGRNIGNSNYGLRLSHLKNGWDITSFYYHSLDSAPTFYRVSGFTEPLVFQARHDQIDQFGSTLAKDFGSVVLKGELVYTDGRKFNVARPDAANGLVGQNTLDYVLGLDFSLPAETRLNMQFFQRVFFSHDPGIVPDKRESGASVLLAGKLWHNVEAQTLLIHSLNRSDWMLRPRLSWNFKRNWRWALGADVFGGEPTGLFGRFNQSDRVYTEVRFSF